VARGFVARGGKVVIVDRDAAAGEALAASLGASALFRTADVTKAADVAAYVKAALDRFGAIDCFHNNAGIEGRVARLAEYEEAVFDQIMAVNVKGVFLGLRHVLPVMIAAGRGGEYSLHRGACRLTWHVGLFRFQACGEWAHQKCGG
jgi:NAD(P)-dependent dehydrogenase (short-subunit alcohol dehydrogenase family)